MSLSANKVALKKRLINRVEKLSDTDIREILDFVEFLQAKRCKRKAVSELDLEKDPILKFMGISDIEPFADKIDQELYSK
ncbi:MAG TPA: DUF2281 domain-containing protein [Nitrospirae bacterium]|nr:DUF2281 domain-containing protein [Nitrospirota bacterium]